MDNFVLCTIYTAASREMMKGTPFCSTEHSFVLTRWCTRRFCMFVISSDCDDARYHVVSLAVCLLIYWCQCNKVWHTSSMKVRKISLHWHQLLKFYGKGSRLYPICQCTSQIHYCQVITHLLDKKNKYLKFKPKLCDKSQYTSSEGTEAHTERKSGAKTAPSGSRFEKWCPFGRGSCFFLNNHV